MGIRERRGREEHARFRTILKAAAKVFAAKGYYQTRMEDVAEAAELAKGTIYYYFGSKDEIYFRLIAGEAEKIFARIRRLIREEDSFLQTLEKLLDFYVDYFRKHPAFLKIFFPCLCGMIRFENTAAASKSARTSEPHTKLLKEALGKKVLREKIPVRLDDLMKFLKTLQIGIGMKLLAGEREEAEHAARFFLDLLKRTMEKSR
jgi:AcrR family transcriptional regulator